jgi:hypothetical protein
MPANPTNCEGCPNTPEGWTCDVCGTRRIKPVPHIEHCRLRSIRGYYCTLPSNHAGEHQTWYGGELIEVWSNASRPELCNAQNISSDGTDWRCPRPAGHTGPHSWVNAARTPGNPTVCCGIQHIGFSCGLPIHHAGSHQSYDLRGAITHVWSDLRVQQEQVSGDLARAIESLGIIQDESWRRR